MKSSLRNLVFPERVLIGVYSLFSLWLLLSLTGIFYAGTVAVCAVAVIGLLAVNRDKKEKSKEAPTWQYWLWLLVPFMMIGWMLLRGFYTGDAYAYWLPWANVLAVTGSMPSWLTMIHMPYTSAGPIWPLSVGALFTVLPVHELSVALLPILFFVIGLFVMRYWMQEKGLNKGYQIVGLLLILFSSQTVFWSWNILTESALFLGYVLFFYHFERTWINGALRNWVLLTMSLIFAMLVKFSSFLLIVPVLLLLFKQRKSINWKLVRRAVLISLPLLIWFARNYAIYGNPVFPIANDLFGGPYAELYNLTNPFQFWLDRFPTASSRTMFIIENLLITYPMVILGLFGIKRSVCRKPHTILLLTAILAGIFLVFSASSGMRYLWPYMSLVAVYAVVALRDMRSISPRAISWIAALWSLLVIVPVNSSSVFISSIESKLSFIGSIAHGIHDYRWIIFVAALPVAYLISKRTFVWQYSLVLLLTTGLLHTRWIGNKSFLNTWSFIIIVLAIILCVVFFKRFEQKKKVLIGVGTLYVCGLFFVNSYAQAGLFYWKNGWQWPVHHVFEQSSVLNPLLSEHYDTSQGDILTLGGSDYYVWYHNHASYTLNSFEFVNRSGAVFEEGMDAETTHALLEAASISIVTNNTKGYNYELAGVLAGVLDSDTELFEKVCVEESDSACIWIVN